MWGVIQKNAHMAHSENNLLSALVDDDLASRKLDLQNVLEAKNIDSSSDEIIRICKPPKVNIHENTYWNIIDWKPADVTVPPLIPNSIQEKAVFDRKLLLQR